MYTLGRKQEDHWLWWQPRAWYGDTKLDLSYYNQQISQHYNRFIWQALCFYNDQVIFPLWLKQWSPNLAHEITFPAEFNSYPYQKQLRMLISVLRIIRKITGRWVWSGLELNSAGKGISWARFEDHRTKIIIYLHMCMLNARNSIHFTFNSWWHQSQTVMFLLIKFIF